MIEILKFFFGFIALTQNVQSQNVPGVCICVPTGTCNNNTGGTGNASSIQLFHQNLYDLFPTLGGGVDGSGNIDIRIQTVTLQRNHNEFSFKLFSSKNGVPNTGATGTSVQLTTAASSGINPIVQTQTFCAAGLAQCCPTNGFQCGVRYPPVGEFR